MLGILIVNLAILGLVAWIWFKVDSIIEKPKTLFDILLNRVEIISSSVLRSGVNQKIQEIQSSVGYIERNLNKISNIQADDIGSLKASIDQMQEFLEFAIKNGKSKKVSMEVQKERVKQDERFGEQNHDPNIYLSILTEEVGEAAKDIVDATHGDDKFRYYKAARKELIQVAAVAQAMVESLDRNELKK